MTEFWTFKNKGHNDVLVGVSDDEKETDPL